MASLIAASNPGKEPVKVSSSKQYEILKNPSSPNPTPGTVRTICFYNNPTNSTSSLIGDFGNI